MMLAPVDRNSPEWRAAFKSACAQLGVPPRGPKGSTQNQRRVGLLAQAYILADDACRKSQVG